MFSGFSRGEAGAEDGRLKPASPWPPSVRLAVLCGALLATLVVWAARETVAFDFVVWDDDINIELNAFLGPPSLTNLEWMWTDYSHMRRYLPVGWMGFSAVYAFSGLSPVGYHVANVVLAVVNAVLLFGLLWWMLRRWWGADDSPWAVACAAIASGSWALHPMRAETVGWASGQLYALAGFFALLSVACYCWAQAGTAAQRTPRLGLTVFFYAVSLLTYPVTLGLISVLVAIDCAERRWRGAQVGAEEIQSPAEWSRAREYFFLVLPFLGGALATALARSASSGAWQAAPTLAELSVVDRVMRMTAAVPLYVGRMICPVDLTPAPTMLLEFAAFSPFAVLAAVAMLMALGGFLFWKPLRAAAPLWFCFLILIFPTLGLTERNFFPSDRYVYLAAMVGSFALAVGLWRARQANRKFLGVLSVAALVMLAFGQVRQLSYWRTTDTLFARMAQQGRHPTFLGHLYRRWVQLHLQRENIPAARAVLTNAEREGLPRELLDGLAADVTRYAQSTNWVTSADSGELARVAAVHLLAAKEAVRSGRFREAHEHFSASLRLAPDFAAARFNYAIFWAMDGSPEQALHLFFGLSPASRAAVTPTARRRLLVLIAQAFGADGRARLAQRAIERAIDEDGPAGESAELRALAEKYRQSATSRPPKK